MLSLLKNKIVGTDIYVSPAGLGTVKFGRNSGVKYPSHFQLPSDSEICSLLALAQSLGVNLIDTAPAYGCSEQRLGKLIEGRQNWVICTKVGEHYDGRQSSFDFSPSGILNSINTSLKNLKTDYLDIVLLHSDGDDMAILTQSDAVATLQRLKQQGVIRAIGLSGKTAIGGRKALEMMDVAMITHNLAYQDETTVIDYANTHNKSILVKKAFASGHLSQFGANPVQSTMEFIFRSAISSVILGTINEKHLVENCQAIADILNVKVD